MDIDGASIRSGTLIKCPRGVSKMYNSKHQQFVVLSNSELRWSNDADSDKAGDYKGLCSLLQIRGVSHSTFHSDRFYVRYGSNSSRIWKTSSTSEAADWVSAIESAIFREKQRLSREVSFDELSPKHLLKNDSSGKTIFSRDLCDVTWESQIHIGPVYSDEIVKLVLADGGTIALSLKNLEKRVFTTSVVYSNPPSEKKVQIQSSYSVSVKPHMLKSDLNSRIAIPLYVGSENVSIAYKAAQVAAFTTLLVSFLGNSTFVKLVGSCTCLISYLILFDALRREISKSKNENKRAKDLIHIDDHSCSAEWSLSIHKIDEFATPPMSPGACSFTSTSTFDMNTSKTNFNSVVRDDTIGMIELDDEDIPKRYVDGCKGDMEEARRRYLLTLAWRRAERIDNILNEPQPHFDTIKKFYPHFYCGRAYSGNLVYYERIGEINMKGMEEEGIDMTDVLRYYTFQTEFLWKHLDTREDEGKLVTVLDVAGIRYSNRIFPFRLFSRDFMSAPSLYPIDIRQSFPFQVTATDNFRDAFGDSIQFVKQASSTAQQHYPERCQMIIICNVPSWFNTIWKIVKAFLDPATLDKIKILKSGALFEELSKHVDPANIPIEYGGKCNVSSYDEQNCRVWASDEEKLLKEYVLSLNARHQAM